MLVFKSLSVLAPWCILVTLSVALPTAILPHDAASSISSITKRVDGDGDTQMKDADQTLPAPGSGPSYAEWMKNLYDMGGKVRRDDMYRYKTSISKEELDAWRLAMQGPNGYGREIGD